MEWIGTTQKGRSRTVTHRRRCRRCGRACRRIAKMSKRRIKYPSQKNVLKKKKWKRKWVSPGAKVTGKKRYRMALRFIRRRRPCNSINLSSSIRTVHSRKRTWKV